jgi:two-component system, OmpR family, phosphate regulon sensor histidine kinase PhoR
MKDALIRRLIWLGMLSIGLIFAVQIWWLSKDWASQEKEFDSRVNIALLKVASELEAFSHSTLPREGLVQRMEDNYYVVNVNGHINPSNLEFYLRENLAKVAINSDFEFGIFDCDSKRMVYGSYIKQEPGSKPEAIKDPLPTYEEFTYYFGLRFPNMTSYVLKSMRITIILSSLLFLIVAFFGYAMIIIFKQKRLSELQKDFINNMTHEFKTPISTIKISADVLLADAHVKEDSRLTRYAGLIKEQNDRLNLQVEKVLQLAKIEDEDFVLNVEKIDLTQLVTDLQPGFEMRVQSRSGELVFSLDKDPVWIEADRLHLTNILHNLLDNAIKYCKEEPHVTVSVERKKDKAILSVADQGIGIAKQHQAKLFDKFYRVPMGNIHNVKGFGLGLFYVKNVASEHKWKLKVDSTIDVGTKISLELPIK